MYRGKDRWANSSANPARKISPEQSAIKPQTHNLHFFLMQISPSQGKHAEEKTAFGLQVNMLLRRQLFHPQYNESVCLYS